MTRKIHVEGRTLRTSEVAQKLGFTNPNTVSSWAKRCGVKALYKEPGHKGQNVYLEEDIEAGLARMPGRGAGGGRPWLRNRT